MRPHIDNDPSKPPARPVVPPHPDQGPPPNGGKPPHIWLGGGGHWEPIDPGYGKPPLWGFILGPDNGLPSVPGIPDNSLPGEGGVWVPTDPDFGKPIRPCPPVTGKPHPPLWAWIPDRPNFPKPTPEPTKTTINPATATVLAAGGSGSVNITTTPAGGSWTVDPSSVPSWIKLNPMHSQSADANCVYSVSTNTTGLAKQALIKINDAVLTINQGAV